MEMIEVEVADLSGAALDWAAAQTEGDDHWTSDRQLDWFAWSSRPWKPSTDWSQGGPLIEKYSVSVGAHVAGKTHACVGLDVIPYCRTIASQSGPTHLIAACRAIVAAKLGDTISVPAELATP